VPGCCSEPAVDSGENEGVQLGSWYSQQTFGAHCTCHAFLQFLRPIYRALFKSSAKGKQLALQTFSKQKSSYHPIATKMLAADLGLPAQ
jgi:hypothetical protein